MSVSFSESDMYAPVKKFFSGLGYDIKSEVKDCDIALVKDNTLIIIEMKKSFNMSLIFQAIERQKMTSQVYVCVPRLKRYDKRTSGNMLTIVKKLNLGLITIAMDSIVKTVEILNFPEHKNEGRNKKKRDSVIYEASSRKFDLNTGGQTKKKIMTAFREKNVMLGCILRAEGCMKPSDMVKKFGCSSDTRNILYRNFYGWFYNRSKGVYGVSEEGLKALEEPDYSELVGYYSENYIKKYNETDAP